MSRWIAAAGGLSQLNAGFFPLELAMVLYCIPITTSSGMFKTFFMAGMKVDEFMLLHEYIIHPWLLYTFDAVEDLRRLDLCGLRHT